MAKIVFVTGGVRSGKSSFAEKLADSDKVLYIATAIPFDGEMEKRIEKHKERRNKNWEILESYKNFDLKDKIENKDFILLECITIMVSNLLVVDNNIDWDNILKEERQKIEKYAIFQIDDLIAKIEKFSGTVIIVSNEVGLGGVMLTPLGRAFQDVLGEINQKIAKIAEEVYFVISGIPQKLKG